MVLNNDPRVIKEYEKQIKQGMDPGEGGPTDQGGENQSGQSGESSKIDIRPTLFQKSVIFRKREKNIIWFQ